MCRASLTAKMRAPPIVTVQSQVLETLRNAILTGRFHPGQRLIESELCRTMGVSRTLLREAIRQLSGQQLVEIVPNRGPSVTRMDRDQAMQIYQIRALLEGEAAALAAAGRDDAALVRMAADPAEFQQAVNVGDFLARLAATTRSYEGLMQASGNPVLAELQVGLLARVTFLRARSMSRPGRAFRSALEMQLILGAVSARDARAARAAAVAHVRSAAKAALDALGSGSSG